jgi:hypothetical protein
MKTTQGMPIYLKILKATRRTSMVSTNPKTRRNRSSTTGRYTVGGVPPPEAIPAHAHDDLEEWFPLGLTYAWVVRKHRGLRRQIRRAYQDRSIDALAYHLQDRD